ncbi:DUF2085 domain-containing protein [Methanocaldococcus indicus]|uniref:DUF2085 domain-containing protein n=1 Tax=Methanocaldococcus indicus TaxID=213231 RepID=UPI003C6CCA35
MPLLSQDNLHKSYIIFLVFYLLFYIGIFLAPFMMNINPDIGLLIYAIYKPICHQLPERSFFIFGHKMAVCARCFGIYTGVLFSSIVYPIVKRLDDFNIPDKKYLILSLLPMAIDGGTQLIGLRESFNILRFITGFLAGSVVVFYIYPIFLKILNKKIMRK